MTRTVKTVKQQDKTIHYVRLTQNRNNHTIPQYQFLQDLVDAIGTGMLRCGPLNFSELIIKQVDGLWIADLKAEEDLTQ